MIDCVMPVWVTDEETLYLTKAAVESIKAEPEARMIIIDNGSTHGQGLLRELADLYIRNKENLGYAKAVNQGLKLAGSVVAVANNDIIASNNWWDMAKRILINFPNVGSVHFRMDEYNSTKPLGEEYWVEGKERWCTSSFFVVRNGQLYDEIYLNSIEDWDYWRTLREKGYTTAYTNAAAYRHKDSHTQQKIIDRQENDQKNRAYYFEKYRETPEEWFARLYPEQLNISYRPFP